MKTLLSKAEQRELNDLLDIIWDAMDWNGKPSQRDSTNAYYQVYVEPSIEPLIKRCNWLLAMRYDDSC